MVDFDKLPMGTLNLKWMDEKIEKLDKMNWLYKVCCFITGRRKKKWSYKEMYVFLVELNRKVLDDKERRAKAINRILEIYKFQNNNNLPDEIKKLDEIE